jgi:hypothetical protein
MQNILYQLTRGLHLKKTLAYLENFEKKYIYYIYFQIFMS